MFDNCRLLVTSNAFVPNWLFEYAITLTAVSYPYTALSYERLHVSLTMQTLSTPWPWHALRQQTVAPPEFLRVRSLATIIARKTSDIRELCLVPAPTPKTSARRGRSKTADRSQLTCFCGKH
jgi:hypothetical protein